MSKTLIFNLRDDMQEINFGSELPEYLLRQYRKTACDMHRR